MKYPLNFENDISVPRVISPFMIIVAPIYIKTKLPIVEIDS